MKKIFLTSGVVLCLACPAFATEDLVPQDNGTYLLETSGTAPNCSTPKTLKYDNAPTTFYAKWQAKDNLVVTYIPVGEDDEGSTTVMAGQSTAADQSTYATYDAPFTVYTNANLATVELTGGGNAVPLSRKGYEFAGWAPDKLISTGGTPGDGFVYAESANDTIEKYLVDGNVNLTAQWTPIRYDVIYHKGSNVVSAGEDYTHENGMIFDVAYQALNFNSTPISGAMSANDGYTFRGWSLDSNSVYNPDGANTWIWTGTTLNDSVDQNVLNGYKTNGFNVYAIYSADTFTLTYDCDGYENDGTQNGGYAVAYKSASYKEGYSSISSRQVGYEFDAVGAAAEPVTKFCELPGYHSTGWRCTYGNNQTVDIADITRIETEQGEPAANAWTIAANVTCTAVWEPNSIGLTWDTRNGEAATNGSCTYDWGINVPAAPTKAGYNFVGWSTTNPEAAGAGEDEVTGGGTELGL